MKLKAPTKIAHTRTYRQVQAEIPGETEATVEGTEPSQKLQLKITADATNVAGAISSDKLKVNLKGEG